MKNGSKLFWIGIVLAIFCVVMIIFGLTPPAELKDAETLTADEITSKYSYYFEDLQIMGEYASQSGGDDGNGSYYIAYFVDADGTCNMVSVYFDNNKTWKATGRDHDYYDSNLSMSACFSTKKLSGLDDDLERYYENSARDLNINYLAYCGFDKIETLDLHLKYVCDEKEDYEDAASNIVATYGGAVVLVISIILIVIGSKQKKREKEEAARAREAAATFYTPNGETPTYQNYNNNSNQNNGPEF